MINDKRRFQKKLDCKHKLQFRRLPVYFGQVSKKTKIIVRRSIQKSSQSNYYQKFAFALALGALSLKSNHAWVHKWDKVEKPLKNLHVWVAQKYPR